MSKYPTTIENIEDIHLRHNKKSRERSLGVQSGRRRDRRNADVRAMGDDVRGADGRGGENGVGGVDAAGERGRVCVDDARGTNG